MGTIEITELCKRFHDLHNGFSAELDGIESYDGYWVIYITDEEYELTSRYVFTSPEEFKEWMEGVVLC